MKEELPESTKSRKRKAGLLSLKALYSTLTSVDRRSPGQSSYHDPFVASDRVITASAKAFRPVGGQELDAGRWPAWGDWPKSAPEAGF
jgi:hypothetical protein